MNSISRICTRLAAKLRDLMPGIDPDDENISQEWKAQPNDLIGGWCVTLMSEDRPLSAGACAIAETSSKELAVHIAATHNMWLRGAVI